MKKKESNRTRVTLERLIRAAPALDAIPRLREKWSELYSDYATSVQDHRERIYLEAQAAACREMIPLIPAAVTDPETLAGEAYAVFCGSLGESYSNQDAKYMGRRLKKTMVKLAKKLNPLNRDLARLAEIDFALISAEALKHGISLRDLADQLAVLEKIAADGENRNTSGRSKDHNTAAALATAQYLMNHGIKRQTAARVVAVLTLHHPDVDSKEWRTIEAAMVDADISAEPRMLGKGGGRAFISLTPGQR